MNKTHPTRSHPISVLRGILAALLSLSLLLSGCTTLRTAALPSAPAGEKHEVKVGNTIVARTRDGHTQEFKVTAIEPGTFVGEHQRVNFDDITQLGVRQFEPVGTTFLVVGGLALVVVIIAAASGGVAFTTGPIM